MGFYQCISHIRNRNIVLYSYSKSKFYFRHRKEDALLIIFTSPDNLDTILINYPSNGLYFNEQNLSRYWLAILASASSNLEELKLGSASIEGALPLN